MDTIAVQELKVSELRALLKHRGACATGNKGELQQRIHDNIELWKLQDENEKLTTRVKKLEAVRLTKEQCVALKRMKIERLQFMKKCEALEATNETLTKLYENRTVLSKTVTVLSKPPVKWQTSVKDSYS